MDSNIQALALSTIIGLFCLSFGAAARLGYFKRMFITRGIPGVYPKNTVYSLMPLGLFFLSLFPLAIWAGEEVLDKAPSASMFFGLAALVLVSLIWQPRWLKPAWLRWLEDNYGHVLEEMFKEARQMGAHEWEAQVRTQTDLEEWADSVARQHGWQQLS